MDLPRRSGRPRTGSHQRPAAGRPARTPGDAATPARSHPSTSSASAGRGASRTSSDGDTRASGKPRVPVCANEIAQPLKLRRGDQDRRQQPRRVSRRYARFARHRARGHARSHALVIAVVRATVLLSAQLGASYLAMITAPARAAPARRRGPHPARRTVQRRDRGAAGRAVQGARAWGQGALLRRPDATP
jgi:hypothetical protein